MIKINRYFFPYIIVFIIAGFQGEVLISVISVLFHELTHYSIARKLGFTGFSPEISLNGAGLYIECLEEASPKEDIIISLSGPLFNILTAIFFYFTYIIYKENLLYIIFRTNLLLGVFNLIPAFPLDGGRILRDLIAFKTLYKRANIIVLKLGIIIGTLIIFFYLCLVFKGIGNFSLGLVGIFIIISCLQEKERISYIIMGDILKKRLNFIKKGFIYNQSTSVYYKKDLLGVLALVEKNRYNIFMILDDEMRLKGTICEEELIEALKIYGNITAEEYLKNKLL